MSDEDCRADPAKAVDECENLFKLLWRYEKATDARDDYQQKMLDARTLALAYKRRIIDIMKATDNRCVTFVDSVYLIGLDSVTLEKLDTVCSVEILNPPADTTDQPALISGVNAIRAILDEEAA